MGELCPIYRWFSGGMYAAGPGFKTADIPPLPLPSPSPPSPLPYPLATRRQLIGARSDSATCAVVVPGGLDRCRPEAVVQRPDLTSTQLRPSMHEYTIAVPLALSLGAPLLSLLDGIFFLGTS